MPNCPTCGNPIKEDEVLCPKCGTYVKSVMPSFLRRNSEKIKTLANGIFICGGAASIIYGMIIFLTANADYVRLSHMYPPNELPYSVSLAMVNDGFRMGFSISLLLLGTFLLSMGAIYQFNSAARALSKTNSFQATIGNSFVLGGFLFASSNSNSLISDFYNPFFGQFNLFSFYVTLTAMVFWALGVALLVWPKQTPSDSRSFSIKV